MRQIAEGIRKELKPGKKLDVGCLEVVFVVGDERYEFGLVEAIDALGRDSYWDERGDWREATEAEVRVI